MLSCHPDIISTQWFKVCTSWGIDVVKKTAVQNQTVEITTEIQTPDSDEHLSGPRALWDRGFTGKTVSGSNFSMCNTSLTFRCLGTDKQEFSKAL